VAVLGPGAHGVVVATADPEEAVARRAQLQRNGIPAATLPELGLETPDPPDDPQALTSFWAMATRRPTVAGGAAADAAGVAADPSRLEDLVGGRPPRRVAVFGGAWTAEDDPDHREAMELGTAVAGAGIQVVNGGYQGIMAAVSRGAAEAGGVAVGVTVSGWGRRAGVNPWLTHEARARDLFARLPLICDADAWVAFPGGAGTLAEVALCWNLLQADPEPNRPLIVVGERWGKAFEHLRDLLVVVDPADHGLVQRAMGGDAVVAQVIGTT